MVGGEGIINRAAKEPPQKLVAEWLLDVYMYLLGQLGRSVWMKIGFEWF
jgi:hypothetical protein